MQMAHSTGLLQFQVRPRQKPIAPLRFFPDVPGPWSRIALKGEPLTREAASKTDETILSLDIPLERFLSSLVFNTVATALYQLGTPRRRVVLSLRARTRALLSTVSQKRETGCVPRSAPNRSECSQHTPALRMEQSSEPQTETHWEPATVTRSGPHTG